MRGMYGTNVVSGAYDAFKDFGTALYLRRGMQKRAFYGKKAVDYLEKAGALQPQGDPYTAGDAAVDAGKGIAAGTGIAGGLYGAKTLAGKLRQRNIDRKYYRELGDELRHAPAVAGETAAEYRTRVMKGAGGGMAAPIRNVDTYRDQQALAKLKKFRNPLLIGGALAGSVLASKGIYDRARASAAASSAENK